MVSGKDLRCTTEKDETPPGPHLHVIQEDQTEENECDTHPT